MLFVNEIFGPTIQGEGKSAGREVLFLRLAGCNLACIWCDTPYTWNWIGTKFLHPQKYDKSKEVHRMSIEEVKQELQKRNNGCNALVVSGGEPLLQQKELIQLFESLPGWWIEVETNGTIIPSEKIFELVSQMNCSPKLSNSGRDNRGRRIYSEPLRILAKNKKTIFKFVVSRTRDIFEILYLVVRYRMINVYLMPEGRTREEYLKNQKKVEWLCKIFDFNYSPRLHILLYGDRRGV